MTKLKEYFFIPALAILLFSCGSGISSYSVTEFDYPAQMYRVDPITMTICTFNIAYANSAATYPDGSSASWSVRRNAVKSFVDSLKPDIIGMQEVRKSQSLDFVSFFESEYGYYDVSRSSATGEPVSNTSGEGLGILYRKDRFDLVSKGFFWLDADPTKLPATNEDGTYGSWNSACRRIAVYTVLKDKKNDALVYFFDGHFDHKSKDARINSCQLIIDKIKEIASITDIKQGNVAVFFVGDLNTAYDSGQLSLLNTNMYYARSSASGEDKETGTYNGYSDKNTIIDHIYYGGSMIKPLTYWVDKTDYGVPFISDHYPVLFKWEYKQ